MSPLQRKTFARFGRSPGSWLSLVLLFVVLVPSLGLLWFMNQAANNERLAVRQKLIDAYRAQLLGAQERLAANFGRSIEELTRELESIPAQTLFARAVRADLADAVVVQAGENGNAYPTAPSPPPSSLSSASRTREAWSAAQALETENPRGAADAFGAIAQQRTDDDNNLAAQAWLARARALVRGGDVPAALAVLDGSLQDARFQSAVDAQGRLLMPNADLLALELIVDPASAHALAVRARLQRRVLDYENVVMSATQRRFLLRELQRREPDANASLTTWLDAEDLAAAFLGAEKSRDAGTALRPSPLAGVWQQASANGRVVFLHRNEKLPARLLAWAAVAGLPADVRLEVVAPGRELEHVLLSVPAGDALPGWRLVLATQDAQILDAATDARITSYVWIVALVVLVALVLAVLALGLVRRQVALTQLRNDLVANVSHELKTPLASMRLLVETLLHSPQFNEQTTREYLQLIATENLRLSRLIGNFLTFSRIERNKFTFDFKPTAPRTLVDDAVAAVRDRFQSAACRFEVDVPENLPRVAADSDAMVTALVNLLDNAWKYSGDEKHIAFTAAAWNGAVEFRVRDNGIGLAPRDAQRVFRRFEQVLPSQPNGGGVGLGLSIVQFIVHAHRGAVRVDSEPGRGSTFTISLPVADQGQP